jgi:hypothetical protein
MRGREEGKLGVDVIGIGVNAISTSTPEPTEAP